MPHDQNTPASAASRRITLLQINDLHGYLEPHPELFWRGGEPVYLERGGLARIAGLFAQVRAETGGAVLALDNGDTFHGTLAAVQSRGEVIASVMRGLRLDAMTAHWDFAYGPEQLRRLEAIAGYPVLACNVFDLSSNSPAFTPMTILERAGLRVAVIGLAASIIDKMMPRHFHEGLRFTNGLEELPAVISRARNAERADLVVVLSHLGFPQDYELAQRVPGIDVILSGHTHHRLEQPVRAGSTVLIQSGSHGSFVGRLDLEVTEGHVAVLAHRLIDVDDTLPVDAPTAEAVAQVLAPFRETQSRVVGSTRTPLDRGRQLEATMDNLLLQAIAEAAGTAIAFSNGWRYGAPVEAGPVTVEDLWQIIPTNPPVSMVELTGAEIREILEQNLEHTFSRDPFDQMGGYVKRFWGLTVLAKVENPAGTRVQQIFAGEDALDPGRVYRVAFVTQQGVPVKYTRSRTDLPIRAIDALEKFLAAHPDADASLRGAVALI